MGQKDWVEINDDSRGTRNTNSQIRFKISMLRPVLCDYSDAWILINWTITITWDGDDDAAKRSDERNKRVKLKHWAPFRDCISKIDYTQIDHVDHLDVEMLMCNFIEYSNSCSKISGSLWKFYRDEPGDALVSSKLFTS